MWEYFSVLSKRTEWGEIEIQTSQYIPCRQKITTAETLKIKFFLGVNTQKVGFAHCNTLGW